MKYFVMMCWVLTLSWLTHAAAGSYWRAPVIEQGLLPAFQGLDASQWVASKDSVSAQVDDEGALFVGRDDNRWAAITRQVPLSSNDVSVNDTSSDENLSFHNLLRFQATLIAETPWKNRISLHPKPVLHLFLENGQQQYPFVSRPMFFQSSVVVDTLVEISEPHEHIDIALVAAPGSNWRLSHASLTAVQEHPRYSSSFKALIALWGLTLLWGVVKAWRRSKLPTLIVGGVVASVLVGVLSSRTQVVKWFAFLSSEIQSLGGQITSGHFSAVMQSGHVILFIALTFLALAFHRQWRLHPMQMLAGIVVLAIATEALQNHVLGRSPDVQDLAFDLIGVGCGVVLYGVLRVFKRLFSRNSVSRVRN